MTNENSEDFGGPYDPGSMPAASLGSTVVLWYRRPWFLVTLGIVVVLAISVITDLPHHITKAQDASEQNDSMHQINTDIAPCVFAIKQSFSFYQEEVTGTLPSANLKQVTKLLVEDETACTFASAGVYDLTNNIQVNDTKAGVHIDSMLSVIFIWVTSDAVAAIKDIQYLFTHPGDPAKLRSLSKQEVILGEDRTKLFADFTAAERVLGVTLKSPKIPALATLSGT